MANEIAAADKIADAILEHAKQMARIAEALERIANAKGSSRG